MNQLRYTLLAALFAVAALASGCRSDQQPSDVMGEEKMAEFLQEAYLLEGFYGIETSFQYDTLYPEMLASYDSLLRPPAGRIRRPIIFGFILSKHTSCCIA